MVEALVEAKICRRKSSKSSYRNQLSTSTDCRRIPINPEEDLIFLHFLGLPVRFGDCPRRRHQTADPSAPVLIVRAKAPLYDAFQAAPRP
jgi:hypothetical protein